MHTFATFGYSDTMSGFATQNLPMAWQWIVTKSKRRHDDGSGECIRRKVEVEMRFAVEMLCLSFEMKEVK